MTCPGAAREGMHAMAANEAGTVVVAWLDLRERGTRIYAALSRDHGVTWSKNQPVYVSPSGSVCECCHPSVAVSEQGTVAIMFRNNIDGHRDMFVAESSDGRTFGAATKLGTGSWKLAACPMDGGGLTLAGGLSTAWRRDDGIFLSSTRVAERRLATGRDPAVAAVGAHTDIAWQEGSSVRLLRDPAAAVEVGPGTFPVLLAFRDRTIVAAEDKGTVWVRVVPR